MAATDGGELHSTIPPEPEPVKVIERLIAETMEELGLKQAITKTYLRRVLICAKLFDKKQHDYGPDNIAKFGDLGVLIRLNDKIERLKTLMMSGEQPEFTTEAFEDTWMDIHIYGMIGLMCLDGSWPKAYQHLVRNR